MTWQNSMLLSTIVLDKRKNLHHTTMASMKNMWSLLWYAHTRFFEKLGFGFWRWSWVSSWLNASCTQDFSSFLPHFWWFFKVEHTESELYGKFEKSSIYIEYSTCAQLISCIDFRMLKSYFREPVHHNTNVHIQYIPYSSFCSPTHSRLINCIQQFKWFNNHFHKSNNCASTSLRLFAGIIFVLFLDNLGIFTHCEVFEQTAAPAPLQGVYKSLDAVLLS